MPLRQAATRSLTLLPISQGNSGLRKITRNLCLDFATFTWTGHPAPLRDLRVSDLGLFSRIMIAKVPKALWTVAFQ